MIHAGGRMPPNAPGYLGFMTTAPCLLLFVIVFFFPVCSSFPMGASIAGVRVKGFTLWLDAFFLLFFSLSLSRPYFTFFTVISLTHTILFSGHFFTSGVNEFSGSFPSDQHLATYMMKNSYFFGLFLVFFWLFFPKYIFKF